MSETGPLHARIRAEVKARIVSGEWPPGHRIPFEHELTAAYGCSRMTVSRALIELAEAGLIERRRKAGSFVRRPPAQSAVLEIHDVAAEVASLGAAYGYARHSRVRRGASARDAARLGVARGAPVLALTCLHQADGWPFCLEDRLIHLAAAPEAAQVSFARTPPGAWLLARIPWTAAEHRIRATEAGDAFQALFIEVGAPCLVIERRTFAGDLPVTHVRLTYPGSAHELIARFAPGPGAGKGMG
jgi:GntR family transcriptional regulator, histidine utilization repressor